MRLRETVRRSLGQVALGEWLGLAVFAVSVWQLKWVADDGYIYLTYVQNLVDLGNGAVFNPGERIEAYTSWLWFATLSAIGFLVPRSIAELPDIALVLGFVLSMVAAALWIPIERRARRPRPDATRNNIVNLPLAVMAGTYVFRSFATSGLETSLLLLWLGACVLAIYRREPSLRTIAVLAGVAPLVRPDLGLVGLALAVVLAVLCRRRRVGGRELAVLALLAVTPLVFTSIGRILYYAQLAPNTFYAKTDAGHGVADGLNYLSDVTSVYGLGWLVLVILAGVAVGAPRRRFPTEPAADSDPEPADVPRDGEAVRVGSAGADFDRWRTERRALLLVLALISAIYVLAVGGDFMHGRFWITPWVFLLGASAGMGSDLAEVVARRHPAQERVHGAIAAAVMSAVVAVHFTMEPVQSRIVDGGSATIDGIIDEGAFYAQQNPNLHVLGADNLSPLFERGVVLAEIADAVDQEIGIAQGAIGQMSFAGQRAGNVYIFDMAGLTQTTGARIEPDLDGRVGHSKIAPEVLVAMNPRVDIFRGIAPSWLPEEATFEYGGFDWMLGNVAILRPLVDAGIVSPEWADALDAAYLDALSGPAVDANLVTFLTARAPDDAIYVPRLRELSELADTSTWSQWLRSTESTREVLGTGGCSPSQPLDCVRRSVERHRADSMGHPDQPDLRTVDAVDGP